uniref:Uncharacterized protein n=1 Tax=Dendroctonus ponderosae TaxID=77166 RepID=J3JVN1_DENPD|nr:unknown [Dendroctonus ponderosae]
MKMQGSVDRLQGSKKNTSEPTFVKDFSEYGQILHIHVSPFEWSKDIMLLAFSSRILFSRVSFQEESVKVQQLFQFEHPSRCTALSLAPSTTLTVMPNQVLFATGGIDHQIRVVQSDLQQDNTCEVISGHTSYINDITFDPDNAYLASASDDNTVKIWYTKQFNLKTTLNLTSPAMVVAWHRGDPGKLMVAEKSGWSSSTMWKPRPRFSRWTLPGHCRLPTGPLQRVKSWAPCSWGSCFYGTSLSLVCPNKAPFYFRKMGAQ